MTCDLFNVIKSMVLLALGREFSGIPGGTPNSIIKSIDLESENEKSTEREF